MHIGVQRYGFQGLDITRAPVAAVVATSTKSNTITSFRNNEAKNNLAKLNTLVTDLRSFVSKPSVSNDTQQVYSSRELENLRNVDYLTVLEPTTYEISRTSVQGANATQVGNLEVSKYDSTGPVTISGQVTTAATKADLTIVGDAQARTTEEAQYTLTTERGIFQFQFSGGEALQDVAARLTDQHADTGVTAEVSGNNLVLRSTTIGSSAQILLERTDTSRTIISERNTSQITAVNATQTTGTSDVISGSIDSQARTAELVYQGASDQTIAGSSAFRLTGNAGSILVSVTKGETLAAVAQRLNQQSASTGVVITQDNDTLRFTSVDKGSTESVRIDQIVQSEAITSTGRNAAQITSFTVDSLTYGTTETLSGQVTQSAAKGSLTIQGSANSTVINTASFALRGNAGTANISITKDETLAAVETRINNLTINTGVTARVSSNQLILESADVGSAAEVEVDFLSLPYTLTTTGRNTAELSSFDVQSFTDGATQTFSGTVTQAADAAEIRFRGNGAGWTNTNATFTLSGSQGSHQFTTTALETLTEFASRVNEQTNNTGVTATVSGRDIYFRSTTVGSAVEINLQVTSGTFNITGGDANGSAFGVDAQATLNGVAYTGAGNNFNFTDAKGSYSFTTIQGYTGSLSTITVTSTAGNFDLTGGDGNGFAGGTDAAAVINGQQLTGSGNRFSVTTAKGQFSLNVAAGFTGTFDSITASSTLDDFSFSGGDQTGTATGIDFVVNVNGTQYRQLSNTITHTTVNGSYELTFDTSHVGQFDPFTISTSAGPQVTGGNGAGHSVGTDAVATLNGRVFNAEADQFTYEDAEVSLSFKIAAGFSGQLDSLTVTTQKEFVTAYTTRTFESPESATVSKQKSAYTNSVAATSEETQLNSILAQIDSFNSLAPSEESTQSVSDEENGLAIALPDPDAESNFSAPNDPAKLTKAQVTGLLYQRLADNLVVNTSPSIEQLLRINLSLFKNNVDVEA